MPTRPSTGRNTRDGTRSAGDLRQLVLNSLSLNRDHFSKEYLPERPVVLPSERFLESFPLIFLKAPLDKAQSIPGRLQDAFCELKCPLQEKPVFFHRTDKTDAVRLPGIDPPSGQAEVLGQSVANDPTERREKRRCAELDLGVAEKGGVRTDTDVAEGCQVEPATCGSSVNGGDDRFGKAPEVVVVVARRFQNLVKKLLLPEFFDVKA